MKKKKEKKLHEWEPASHRLEASFKYHAMLDLPTNIVASIVSDWLEAKSVARYDAALCNRAGRASYMEVLRSPQVTLREVTMYHASRNPCAVLTWVVQRSLRVRKVIFWGTSAANEPAVTAFLTAVGPSIEAVTIETIREGATMLCRQISLLCPQLTHFECGDVDNEAFSLLLQRCSRTLSSLKIHKARFPVFPAAPVMPAMQHLSFIAKGSIHSRNIPRLIRNCPNLLTFKLSNPDGWDLDTDETYNHYLVALAETCPRLQRLCCDVLSDDVEIFTQLLQSCTELHTVELQNGYYFETGPIEATLRYYRKLRALRVQHMQEATIPLLVTRLPQLQHLSFINLHCHTAASLDLIAEHCGHLSSFDLHLYPQPDEEADPGDLGSNDEPIPTGPDPPESAFLRLFAKLQNVETLDLTSANRWMTDGIMQTIAAHCPRLHTLALPGTEPSHEAFTALVQQCTQLRAVHCYYHDSTLGPAGNGDYISEWVKMRPGLTFDPYEEPTFGYWGTGVNEVCSAL
jgi:hypothetical protein